MQFYFSFEKVLSFGQWPYTKPVYVLSSTLISIPEHLSNKAFLINGDINISDSNTKPADNLSSLNFTTHLNVGFKSGINSLDLSALNMADLLTIPNLVLVALVTEISTYFSIPIETSISFFKSS